MAKRRAAGLAWMFVGVAMTLLGGPARAQEEAQEEPSTGFSVEGVIRSTRGGFAFPDGRIMRAPPRLETGGPFECAPPAGESRSCAIGGQWDFCALSAISLSRFNAFVEPRCAVVDRGEGLWSIDVVSTGQFIIRCMASCLRLPSR
jgi:hypothetical protein